MTALLKQAFAQAEELPEWEQDALAAFILEEIAASYQWDKLEHPHQRKTSRAKQQQRLAPTRRFQPAQS